MIIAIGNTRHLSTLLHSYTSTLLKKTMQRPVEINQKKTRLLQIAALGLGVAAILTWVHYDELLPFSWDAVFHAIGIVITSITGLTALVALAISLFRHEPYLLVYDDRIEMPRLLSRNCRVLHFCDVKSMWQDGEGMKMKALFSLQPYLKRSDLPGWTRFAKKYLGVDFGISLKALDMPSQDAYNLMYDRYQRYYNLNRSQSEETEDEVLDRYLTRLATSSSIGKWRL